MPDVWGPGGKKPYPTPMVVLEEVWYRSESDLERYNEVIAPFLDRLIGEFPVGDYPPDAPRPPLERLIADWKIDVVVGDSVARTYRGSDSSKKFLLEFPSPRDLNSSWLAP